MRTIRAEEGVRASEGSVVAHTLIGIAAVGACVAMAWGPDWLADLGIVEPSPVVNKLTRLLLVVAVFCCEWFLPVDAKQSPISPGFAHDVIWYSALSVFRLTVFAAYVAGLSYLYNDVFHLPVVDWPNTPLVVRAAIAIVAGDFLWWCSHWLRHRVPLFWRFHAVHHSQREMNIYLSHRQHPINDMIDTTTTFIPSFALGLPLSAILVLSVFVVWYPMLCHANVRTNFGLLRYLLVTPQSHRLHHATVQDHCTSNYAVIFSVWDRLFGTHLDGVGVYPETGLPGTAPRSEPRPQWRDIPGELWRNLAEPFQQVARDWRR